MIKILVFLFVFLVLFLHFVPVSEDSFATSGCVPASASTVKVEDYRIITGQNGIFNKLKRDATLAAKRQFLKAACATDIKVRKLYLL